MHGLVNKAIQGMVLRQFDAEIWGRILERAGVDADAFAAAQTPSDTLTYRLVAAASEVLATPISQLLEGVGEYWLQFIADEGYGDLLDANGTDVRAFLLNLDALHARIDTDFPGLKPLSFQCADVTEFGLTLHYHSSREGFAPMVIGLVRGVGQRFGTALAVEHIVCRDDGADHDEFRVEFGV